MIAKGKYRAKPMVFDSPTVHMKPTVALRFCTLEFLKSNPAPAKNGIVQKFSERKFVLSYAVYSVYRAGRKIAIPIKVVQNYSLAKDIEGTDFIS